MKSILLPPSKSVLHRELIATFLACRSQASCAAQASFAAQDSCASFAEKAAALLPPTCSDDLRATRDSLLALGEGLRLIEERGRALPDNLLPLLLCRESGTTLRLLLPVAAALGMPALFSMEGRLPHRPMDPLLRVLEEHGCRITRPAPHLLQITGKLLPGDFVLPGNLSSQYFSGLLFALPLLDGESRLRSEGPLESAPYVEMTLAVLRDAGIALDAFHPDGGFDLIVPGHGRYRLPKSAQAEGDWSGAAFWLAAGILGEEPLKLHGLSLKSLQGDRAVLEILRRFGAAIDVQPGDGEDLILVSPSRGRLRAPEAAVDVSAVPDLLPPLALVAALSPGTTAFTHAERLRLKESDRLHAVTSALRALGADILELEDGLRIIGVPSLHGGIVDSFRDHRIAMTAIAASASLPPKAEEAVTHADASRPAEESVVLQGASCIAKSYPSFLADFRRIYPKAPLETL